MSENCGIFFDPPPPPNETLLFDIGTKIGNSKLKDWEDFIIIRFGFLYLIFMKF